MPAADPQASPESDRRSVCREFGFELMQWQGYVRARRAHYEQAHVITYPGRDYLYENCVVHYHDIRLEKLAVAMV